MSESQTCGPHRLSFPLPDDALAAAAFFAALGNSFLPIRSQLIPPHMTRRPASPAKRALVSSDTVSSDRAESLVESVFVPLAEEPFSWSTSPPGPPPPSIRGFLTSVSE